MNRNLGLDLARFIAATVVMMGHLLFTETLIYEYSRSNPLLRPFMLGSVSVAVFFLLSGFVLTPKVVKFKNHPKEYFFSRLVRLYPIYFLAWLFPNVFYILFAAIDGGPLLANGIASFTLSALASQSWTRFYLDPPNPPLWSLSAEIWLSCLFIILAVKVRVRILVPTVLLLYGINLFDFFRTSAILYSLPFFLTGIIFSKIRIFDFFSIGRFTLILFALCTILTLSLIKSLMNQESHLVVSIQVLVLSVFVFVFFGSVKIPLILSNFIEVISARTYSLYATHFPILVLIKNQNYLPFPKNPVIYIVCTSILILTVTEVTYRTVEKPSLEYSRRFRIN